MVNWGRNWGRDIYCECETAACIGPHQRGKNGSSCRTGCAGPRGSERFRPGTGDLDLSESAIEKCHSRSLGAMRKVSKLQEVYTSIQHWHETKQTMDISNEKVKRKRKSRGFKCNRSMSMFESAVMKHDTTRTIGLKHAQVRLRQPYFLVKSVSRFP